jgi:hypothetical protein
MRALHSVSVPFNYLHHRPYPSPLCWSSLWPTLPLSMFLYSWLFPTDGSVCSHMLTLVPRSRILLPWRRYVPPKRRLMQDLHSAKSQKTTLFSNQILCIFSILSPHLIASELPRILGTLQLFQRSKGICQWKHIFSQCVLFFSVWEHFFWRQCLITPRTWWSFIHRGRLWQSI